MPQESVAYADTQGLLLSVPCLDTKDQRPGGAEALEDNRVYAVEETQCLSLTLREETRAGCAAISSTDAMIQHATRAERRFH